MPTPLKNAPASKRMRYRDASAYIGVGRDMMDQLARADVFTVQVEGKQNNRFLMRDELDVYMGRHDENAAGDAGQPDDVRRAIVREFRRKHKRVKAAVKAGSR